MITEYGAIKTQTAHDKKMYGQFNKGGIIVLIIFGFLELALGLTFCFTGDERDFVNILFIIFFAVIALFCFGLVFVVSIAIKKNSALNQSNVAELYSDYMLVCVYDKDKCISQNKIYYKDAIKKTESKDYFFVQTTAHSFIPIAKAGLAPAELNGIRRLLNLPLVAGDTSFVPSDSLHAETTCTVFEPSADVFEDFPDDKRS